MFDILLLSVPICRSH